MKHIAAGAGLILGLFALGKDLWGRPTSEWGGRFVYDMTGYNMSNRQWEPTGAIAGLPIAAGVGVSYLAAKTGINRYTPKGINL